MAISEGGSPPTPNFNTGFLSARENAPNRVGVPSKPDIKISSLAQGLAQIKKLLLSLKK